MTLNIPEFHLPPLVAKLGRTLPQWPHSLALCGGLNAALAMGLFPADDLGFLDGKSFSVIVEDTGGTARFTYLNGRFRPILRASAQEDVCFRGELSAFLKLVLRQEDPDTLFFNRQISIEGDTELGLAVKNMLDAIDWPPASLAELLTKLRQPLKFMGWQASRPSH